ncbi:MAG: YCF48-related protein [candidate division WOR-3 bacterium]
MKRQILLFSSLILLSNSQELKWRWINPLPADGMFVDVDFFDEQNGFAVDFEGGLILKTTNGGQTWSVSWALPPENPGYYRLMGISYPALDTAYAVGWWGGNDWQGSYGYVICRTTDRGQTWTLTKWNDTFRGLNDVYFVNSRTGYAVGRCDLAVNSNPAIIVKTTNGGQNWVVQNSGMMGDLWGVCFVNEQTGYAVGDTILKTTNGGSTWVKLNYAVQGGPLRGVHFPVDANTGYACGFSYQSSQGGTVIKTTNGGASWQILMGGQTYSRYHGLYFLNNQTGYLIGNDPNQGLSIMKTTNGGSSWSYYPVNYNFYYADKAGIDFVNQSVGYIATNRYLTNIGNAIILKTTDAGNNWSTLLPASGQLINYNFLDMDLRFLQSHQIGYVVGGLGKIFKTTDGGTTWFSQFTGTGQDFRSVHFISPDTGWAGGENGTLFYTTNGGNTWIPKNSGTTDQICRVFFVNDSIGFFTTSHLWSSGYTGYDSCGSIYKTTNKGQSWFVVAANLPIGIYGISFPHDPDTGYICGQAYIPGTGPRGRIYKTTNGGANWVEQWTHPTRGAYLYCMQFINNQLGFCGGFMQDWDSKIYNIWKTTNGGNTWSVLQVGTNTGLVSVVDLHFPAIDTGYIVMPTAGYHLMLKTTNGCGTWTPINLQTQHTPACVEFINTQVGFIAGYCGMIRKTTNGGNVWIEEDKDYEKQNVKNENGILQVYPNPFRNDIHIRCRMHDSGYMIKIYDVAGRVVKSFNPVSCILNHESSIIWFGDDNLGRELPAGVYFIVPEDKRFSPVRVVKIR